MAPRREGEQSPYWKRMEVVMKVYMGQMNATDAAQELGISRAHYYKLEEEMLRAALGAVTPQKTGPKTPQSDPEKEAMTQKLKETQRERELLQIKVKHLEELQRDMVTRGIGVLREKKRHRSSAARRHRTKVHGPVQAGGAVEGGRAAPARRDDQGTLPGTGAQPGESVSMESPGRGEHEAGPETTGR